MPAFCAGQVLLISFGYHQDLDGVVDLHTVVFVLVVVG
jgi:hypothetical protein